MDMAKRSFLTAGLAGMATMMSGCSTISLFSTFTPKDSGATRVARDVHYGDDPRQTYDVYAPDNASGFPVIVFFYGGGWNSGSKADYTWFGMALAAMGYVVAVPDYRLTPQVVYPAFLDDGAAAIKHVTQHAATYGGDGTRLALMGHSAGAYNAVMLALDPHYLGVDAAGKSPVLSCIGVSGPYDFLPFDVKESRDTFGAWPRPEETQPIHYIHKTNTHFLLMASRADHTVYLKNSVSLQSKLLAAGTDCRLHVYEGLNHADTAAAFSLPFRGKGTLYADARTFFRETLG